MSSTIELVVFSLTAVLGLGLMATNSLLRYPEWLERDEALKTNWRRLTGYSVITGALFGTGALLLNLLAGWNQQSVVFASLGGYIFFQSMFTDLRLRRVDRWGQRIANVISLAVGCYVLSQYGTEVNWIIYLSFVAATFAIGLLPGVGDSDGRAFMFLVIATYPISAIAGLQWSAILFLACLIVYYVGMSIWKREFSIRGLFTKVSFPMVPIIILPVLIVTMFGRALPGF